MDRNGTEMQDTVTRNAIKRTTKRPEGWRVRVARAFFWVVVAGSTSVIFLLLFITLSEHMTRLERLVSDGFRVPLAFFITIPGLCVALIGVCLATKLSVTKEFCSPSSGTTSARLYLFCRPSGRRQASPRYFAP